MGGGIFAESRKAGGDEQRYQEEEAQREDRGE